ncbi:cytochrome bd-I oxidase subunit CydX [Photobacterium sanctipauli]|uniref:Cytochrome bd-I oxidase subunit CydX n=1 Tax=Photobacterium sanctipauli TaxID=1342794 RepID=A0A2T3NPL1_9GAMM|nr:cytochrome bd oxidase small subunit, CydX/CbdX family [Photobacterium sanctipauli]PSW18188.1 cytochrome bd-I oxidase subunit CydX [Photobacterium sanctipauli]
MWYVVWVIGLIFASYCGAINGFRMERKEQGWKNGQD